MKNRIINTIKLARLAWINPQVFQTHTFKMLSDMLILIFKVAKENHHMMTNVAIVHPDGESEQIVSIWAGAGIGATPNKRITELLEENKILKRELSEIVSKKQNENK